MKYIFQLIIMAMVFYRSNVSACDINLSEGIYLNQLILDHLSSIRIKSKEPPKGISGFLIKVIDGKTYINFIWNLHEGDSEREIMHDCSLSKASPLETDEFQIKKNSKNKIEIYKNKKIAGNYKKITSIEDEINIKAIAGRYKTQNGEIYVFYSNGYASINGKLFSYRVIIDRIEFQSDIVVLTDKSTNLFYAMKWSNKKLTLAEYVYEYEYGPLKQVGNILKLTYY